MIRRQPKNTVLESAGSLLTKFRLRAGFTLKQAAKAAGTSASYLSEVENGIKRPGDDLLIKLAELYEVPDTLLLEKFGRNPSVALLEELEKNYALKQLLTEIKYSTILKTDEEKREVMEKVLDYFKELVEEKEKSNKKKRSRMMTDDKSRGVVR